MTTIFQDKTITPAAANFAIMAALPTVNQETAEPPT
jgi:hypothetical protein